MKSRQSPQWLTIDRHCGFSWARAHKCARAVPVHALGSSYWLSSRALSWLSRSSARRRKASCRHRFKRVSPEAYWPHWRSTSHTQSARKTFRSVRWSNPLESLWRLWKASSTRLLSAASSAADSIAVSTLVVSNGHGVCRIRAAAAGSAVMSRTTTAAQPAIAENFRVECHRMIIECITPLHDIATSAGWRHLVGDVHDFPQAPERMANEQIGDRQKPDQYQGEDCTRHRQIPHRERHHQCIVADRHVDQRGLEHEPLEVVLEAIHRPRGQICLDRGFGEPPHGRAGRLAQRCARRRIEVYFRAVPIVTRHASGRHDRGNRLAHDGALDLDAQRQTIFLEMRCHALDRHAAHGLRELPVQALLYLGFGEGELAGSERAEKQPAGREDAGQGDDDPGKLAPRHLTRRLPRHPGFRPACRAARNATR